MRRQPPTAGLMDVARGVGARVSGCWGEHLRRSAPLADERGCTVSCGTETAATTQCADPNLKRGSKSDSGCWRRSQSGIGSGASSQAGGPRAGMAKTALRLRSPSHAPGF
jgi:hypothetical protein